MLHEDQQHVGLHLLVLLEDIDRLLIVGHRLRDDLGCIGRHHDTAEEFLHLGLEVVDIDVTNHDDGLVVWTIPLTVVGTQGLGLEAVNNAHQTLAVVGHGS